jgi:hypothetical protein
VTVDQFVKQAYAWLLWICTQIITVGFLLLFAGSMLALFGARVPYVPVLDFTALAYFAGAWWLYRRATA